MTNLLLKSIKDKKRIAHLKKQCLLFYKDLP